MQRSLAYYRHALAPVMDGPVKTPFWLQSVQRAVVHQPAVRHAVMAISILAEHADLNQPMALPASMTGKVRSALWHYNQAIHHTLALDNNKQRLPISLLPLICLLFVCIEFLRADFHAAFHHFKSGVRLLDACSAGGSSNCPTLVATYRHLLIFPPFTHHWEATLNDVDKGSDDDLDVSGMDSVAKAQEIMDILVGKAARLTHWARLKFIGALRLPEPLESILSLQHSLLLHLEQWRAAFSLLQRKGGSDEAQLVALLFLEMRYLVTLVRVKARLADDEMEYDKYHADFQRIVHIGAQVRRINPAINQHRFTFRGGFCPLLQTVVMKCRNFKTRLEALELMKALSCYRESIWHFPVMLAVGQRAIQMEHGVNIGGTSDGLEGQGDGHGQVSSLISCRGFVTHPVLATTPRIVEYSWDFCPKYVADASGGVSTGYGYQFWLKSKAGAVSVKE